MAVTLSKLAKELGVSTMTVSRALRGVGRIGEETRNRIVLAARRHGYRPHALARAMRSGRSGCVALFCSAAETSGPSSHLAAGLDEALAARRMYLAVARVRDGAATAVEDFAPRLLGESLADGILVNCSPLHPAPDVDVMCERRVACIWINSKQGNNCVYADDFDAARRATRRLLELGHRRIAFANHHQSPMNEVGSPLHYSFRDRYEGYASVMEQVGLPRRRVGRHPLVSFVETWRAILAEPANQRPTAVICYSRYTAHPILQAAGQLGRDLPRDLSLISFDAEPADEFEFPLTTMLSPEREMGCKAVEMLCARMDDPAHPQPAAAIPVEWFEGGTLGPMRAGG